jgi:hypothetical protein
VLVLLRDFSTFNRLALLIVEYVKRLCIGLLQVAIKALVTRSLP